MWPVNQRPEFLRVKATVNSYKIEDLLTLYKFSKETEKAEKDDIDDSSLKEVEQPTVKYKVCEDNGKEKLSHRWLSHIDEPKRSKIVIVFIQDVLR